MKNLVIKLNHELTEKYLAMAAAKTKAEMDNTMEASGVSLEIKLSLVPGLDMLDELAVNGKRVSVAEDNFSAVEVKLEDAAATE